MDNADLIKAFIDSFAKLNSWMSLSQEEDFPSQLVNAGIDPEDWSRVRWQPGFVSTDHSHLQRLRSEIGRRLPRLYEQLITSYRWLEVDLPKLTLMANPPGDSLDGLWRMMTAVPGHETLFDAGFMPFGSASTALNWMCFDLNTTNEFDDCPIVHLEVKSNWNPKSNEMPYKINRLAVIWPSVEAMMQETIEEANRRT